MHFIINTALFVSLFLPRAALQAAGALLTDPSRGLGS